MAENSGSKMGFRIKDLHRAAKKCIRSIGKYKPYDRGSDRNDKIMSWLFAKTKNGQIKGFYLDNDSQFKAYHRSTKENGKIQYSYGFFRDGELIPCGDVQMGTAEDLIREGYSSGIYKIIA